MVDEHNYFLNFEPFRCLSVEALQKLSRLAERKIFMDGQIIFLESENIQKVFFILDGNIKVYRSNLSGREQNLVLLQSGDIFNLPVAFLQNSQTRANALALGTAEVVCIPFGKFRSICSETPEIAACIFKILSKKIADLTELTYDLSLRSVRARLALFLLNHASDVSRSWTQAEIAAQIGTVREVVSRTLRNFIKEGLVKLERQKIVIRDIERLKQESFK